MTRFWDLDSLHSKRFYYNISLKQGVTEDLKIVSSSGCLLKTDLSDRHFAPSGFKYSRLSILSFELRNTTCQRNSKQMLWPFISDVVISVWLPVDAAAEPGSRCHPTHTIITSESSGLGRRPSSCSLWMTPLYTAANDAPQANSTNTRSSSEYSTHSDQLQNKLCCYWAVWWP